VIVVGWGGGANEVWYPQSASNTRAIGREIKLIAERLVSRNGANANNFWCVGHSLGAHTCGIAGMETRFGRVTGNYFSSHIKIQTQFVHSQRI